MDNKLKWNTQVKKVIKSYSAKVGQLKRMAYLPIHVQEEIYFKTIIAAVAYGMTVWWTCSPSHTEDLFIFFFFYLFILKFFTQGYNSV